MTNQESCDLMKLSSNILRRSKREGKDAESARTAETGSAGQLTTREEENRVALNSFNVYHSYLQSLEPLNDSERGRLFTAMLSYSITGKQPELRGNERFVFPAFAAQMDRDKQKYAEKCEKNRRNAQKRTDAAAGARRRFAAFDAKDKDMEKDKEKDREKDREKDNDNLFPAEADAAGEPSFEEGTSSSPADDSLALIAEAYEKSIGMMPRHVAEQAASFLAEGLEPGLIARAIELAAENNVRKWSYAAAILRDCGKRGVRSAEELEAERRKRDESYSAGALAARPAGGGGGISLGEHF